MHPTELWITECEKKSKSIVTPSCWHAMSTRHSDNTTSTVLPTMTTTTNGYQTLRAHHQHHSQWCVKSCTPTTAFDNGGEVMNGEKWQTGRSINDQGLRRCLSRALGMFLFCLSFPFFTNNLRTMLHARQESQQRRPPPTSGLTIIEWCPFSGPTPTQTATIVVSSSPRTPNRLNRSAYAAVPALATHPSPVSAL